MSEHHIESEGRGARRASTRAVGLFAAALVVVAACGGDSEPASVDTVGDAVVADTAPIADTSVAPDSSAPTDTVTSADTEAPPDTAPDAVVADTVEPSDAVSSSCTVGETRCEAYLRMRCNSPARGFEVVELCELGCDDGGATAVCATTCAAGAALGCVNGSARRCDAAGGRAVAVACLGGCDAAGADCEPLGANELEVYAANVAGVRVAAVGGDDAGRLGFAWQATGQAEPVRLFVTDSDGNALASPVALGGSGGSAFAQLQVRGGPDGAFAVLALDASSASLWHVPTDAGGAPVAPAAPLATEIGLKFPSLVAWEGQVALYDLGAGELGAGGGSYVRRTQWPVAGGAPVVTEVDGAVVARDDVIAARVGSALAHVFSVGVSELRATTSTPDAPGVDTVVFAAGGLLLAGAAGPAASVLAAFDFDADPSRAVIARYDGVALSAWSDLGPARWLQATATATGRAVALQTADGVLRYAEWAEGATKEPVSVWVPDGGAQRIDFWVVYDAVRDRVRLVTLGRDGAGQPLRVRISAP